MQKLNPMCSPRTNFWKPWNVLELLLTLRGWCRTHDTTNTYNFCSHTWIESHPQATIDAVFPSLSLQIKQHGPHWLNETWSHNQTLQELGNGHWVRGIIENVRVSFALLPLVSKAQPKASSPASDSHGTQEPPMELPKEARKRTSVLNHTQ